MAQFIFNHLEITDKIVLGLSELTSNFSAIDIKMKVYAASSKMLDREKQDLMAFLRFCEQHEKGYSHFAINAMHDINGINNHEPCFCPRTSGYSDIVKALKE